MYRFWRLLLQSYLTASVREDPITKLGLARAAVKDCFDETILSSRVREKIVNEALAVESIRSLNLLFLFN